MKKLLSLTLVLLSVLVFSGCAQQVSNEEIDCDLYPDAQECQVADPENPQPGIIEVLDELPTTPISIEFWHTYGQEKEALLLAYVNEFTEIYENVTITLKSQGNYDDLRTKTILAISGGNTPTMLVAYPDHIAGYLNGNAVIPLDDFIYDDVWGVEINDFVDGYVEENRQYEGGFMYSMPYSKSTEMMVYNKTVFDAHGITIPNDTPITFDDLVTYSQTVMGTGTNQCEYLINYDSDANFFINNVRMWDGGYTNSQGHILVDDANTVSMLNTISGYFQSKMISLPAVWNQNYGSTNFKEADVCMSVGSTAGVTYNVPNAGTFEMGIAPIPQYDFENNPSAVQQGPNVAIMSDSTPEERLAAWLFIKYITEAEQTAKWSMLTGYLPVRKSGYESAIYQEFLSIANIEDLDNHVFSQELLDFLPSKVNDPVTGEPIPASPADYLYESMAANAAYAQIDYYQYDPAFAMDHASSSDARLQAGIAMTALLAGTVSVDDIVAEMMSELNADDVETD